MDPRLADIDDVVAFLREHQHNYLWLIVGDQALMAQMTSALKFNEKNIINANQEADALAALARTLRERDAPRPRTCDRMFVVYGGPGVISQLASSVMRAFKMSASFSLEDRHVVIISFNGGVSIVQQHVGAPDHSTTA